MYPGEPSYSSNTAKNARASGGSATEPPPRALKRAPGPHAVLFVLPMRVTWLRACQYVLTFRKLAHIGAF